MTRSISMQVCAAAVALSVGSFVIACGAEDRSFEESAQAATDPAGNTSSSGTIGGQLGSSGGASGSSGDPTGDSCAAQVNAAARAEVDIIIAIDTSGSMSEETDQVKANINTFAQKIGATGLDANVVMLGSPPPAVPMFPGFPTPPGVCVPPPLGHPTCGQSNPPGYYQITSGVDSTNSLEQLIAQLPKYDPWLRPTAFKVFIEVTDDESDMGYKDFDDKLLAKSPANFGTAAARRYVFNSICGWKKGTPVLSSSKCSSAVNIGEQYQKLSELTGGIVDSVCETDYSGVFDNIAKGLVKRLGCEFSYPKQSGGNEADPTRVAVQYTPSGATKKNLTQVTDASKCGSIADAWYYDDNTKPTKILFCPTTCASAGQDTNGKLEIAVGCKVPAPK